jgi:predicted dehydrogenase
MWEDVCRGDESQNCKAALSSILKRRQGQRTHTRPFVACIGDDCLAPPLDQAGRAAVVNFLQTDIAFDQELLSFRPQSDPSEDNPQTRSLLNARRQVALPLTFKHFAKAGGTYIQGVLEKVIPEPFLTIKNETQSLVPEVEEGHFVLGSIRNPCEYYPSLWAHMMCEKCEWGDGCYMVALPEDERQRVVPGHRDPPFNTSDDIQRFRAFVQNTSAKEMNIMSLRFWAGFVRLREEEGAHEHIADRSTPKQYIDVEMTSEERDALFDEMASFDPSTVDCWIKVESMEEDLLVCLRKYSDEGGSVQWDKVEDAMASSTQYESDHGECQTYYDAETEALVRHGDAHLFEKFGYGSCCEEPRPSFLAKHVQYPPTSASASITARRDLNLGVELADSNASIPTGMEIKGGMRHGGEAEHGEFVLVTGSEGAGVSMLTKVLCNADDVMCIPADWKLSELSPSAQEKYVRAGLGEMLDQDWMAVLQGEEVIDRGLGQNIVAFNSAINDLWHDRPKRPYIEHDVDTRDGDERNRLIDAAVEAALVLLSAFRTTDKTINRVIFDRSMPFSSDHSAREHSPFFHDLSDMAVLFGAHWSSRSVVVVRDIPSTLVSHNDAEDYMPFLIKQEQLLANGPSGVPMVWVSYARMMCDPESALAELAQGLGRNEAYAAFLASSPEFDATASVNEQHLTVEYVEQVTEWRKEWNQVKTSVPVFTKFLEAGETCCVDRRRWIVIAPVLALAAYALWVSWGSQAERLRFKLQFLSYMDVFWVHLQYAAMIPMAYDVAIELGQGMTFSGLLIGSYWGAVSFGSLLVARPFVSQAHQSVQRICALWAMLVMVVCNLTYIVGIDPPASWHLSQNQQTWLVLGSRVFSGFAWSSMTMVVSCMAVKATPKADQVKQEGFRAFFITLGIGCGPFLATANSMKPAGLGVVSYTRDQLAFPSWVCCCIGVMVLILAWVVVPDREGPIEMAKGPIMVGHGGLAAAAYQEQARVESDLAFEATGRNQLWWKKLVYMLGCAYGVERALLTSSLESATALVLQSTFGWSPDRIGETVGFIFIGAAFLIFCVVSFRPLIGDAMMLKSGSTICLCSCVLLCYGITSSASMVIVSDVLIFTSGFVASSVEEGMAMACATPGTFYSVENAWTIRNVLKCNLSRFVGPVLARYAIAADGGHIYAISQLSLAVFSCLLCYCLSVADKWSGGSGAKSAKGSETANAGEPCTGVVQAALDCITNGLTMGAPKRTSRYRLGICGLGNVSDFYLENLNKLCDRFELVAACDPDASKRRKLPDGVVGTEDLGGLLSHDLDCVVIAVPTAAHFVVANQVIAASLPMLLEKPAATSMQELETLYRLSGHQVLQVAMHGCYAKDVLWMATRKDDFGALLDFEAWFFDPYMADSKLLPQAWSLGGSWLDSGVNAITCLTVALGKEVVVLGLNHEWYSTKGSHMEINNAGDVSRRSSANEQVYSETDRKDEHATGSVNIATTARVHMGNACGLVRTDWRRGVNEKGIKFRFERATVTLQLTAQRVLVDDEVVADFSAYPRMVTRYFQVLNDFAAALDMGKDNRELAGLVHHSLFSHMDGVGDNVDAFPADDLETLDTDGDRFGDNADPDDDGDGVDDGDDPFPLDASKSPP